MAGCRSVDHNFLNASPRENLPLILGLLGVWNNNFLGYSSRAIAAYSEAMLKLAPHIQQVDMESNGKNVTLDGRKVDFRTGEVGFGEPGTNAQHSFFQLFHQGQVVPVDFIGFAESQTVSNIHHCKLLVLIICTVFIILKKLSDLTSFCCWLIHAAPISCSQPISLKGDEVSNHDELMANFFAQPDALAVGKSEEELLAEKVDPTIVPHRVMPGNRPSNVLFFSSKLTAYEVGQILSLYEHRTVVQGFIWNINSFDQFGVELGKKLADKVRSQLVSSRAAADASIQGFNPSTTHLLQKYLTGSKSSKL